MHHFCMPMDPLMPSFEETNRILHLFILSIILYVTLFFFSSYLLAINIVLLILFVGAFSTLINMLNAVSVLEKSIEPSQYKTLYHKGLADYKKEDESI